MNHQARSVIAARERKNYRRIPKPRGGALLSIWATCNLGLGRPAKLGIAIHAKVDGLMER